MSVSSTRNRPHISKIGDRTIVSGFGSDLNTTDLINDTLEVKKIDIRKIEDRVVVTNNKVEKLEELRFYMGQLKSALTKMAPVYGGGVFNSRMVQYNSSGIISTEEPENYVDVQVNGMDVPVMDFAITDTQLSRAKSIIISNLSDAKKDITSDTITANKLKVGTFSILPNNIVTLSNTENYFRNFNNIGNNILNDLEGIFDIVVKVGSTPPFKGEFSSLLTSASIEELTGGIKVHLYINGEDYVTDFLEIDSSTNVIPADTVLKFQNSNTSSGFKIKIKDSDISVEDAVAISSIETGLINDLTPVKIIAGKSLESLNHYGKFGDLSEKDVVFYSDTGNWPTNDELKIQIFEVQPVNNVGDMDASITLGINGETYSASSLGNSKDVIEDDLILSNSSGERLYIALKDNELSLNVSDNNDAQDTESLLNGLFHVKQGTKIVVKKGDSLNDIVRKLNNIEYLKAILIKANNNNYKIRISSRLPGIENEFELYDHDNVFQGVQSNMTTVNARNASFILDGLYIERSANRVDDVIDGVVINIKRDMPASANINVDILSDNEPIISMIKEFINAYNTLQEFIYTQQEVDEQNRYVNTAVLGGDRVLTLSEDMVSKNLFRVTGNINQNIDSLNDIGIKLDNTADYTSSTRKIKKMILNESTLRYKLENNFDEIQKLFALSIDIDDSSIENFIYTGALNHIDMKINVTVDIDFQQKGDLTGKVLNKLEGIYNISGDKDMAPYFVGDIGDLLTAINVSKDINNQLSVEMIINGQSYNSETIKTNGAILAKNTEIQLANKENNSGFCLKTVGNINISDSTHISTLEADLLDEFSNINIVQNYTSENVQVKMYNKGDDITKDSPIASGNYTDKRESINSNNPTQKAIFGIEDIHEKFLISEGSSLRIKVVSPNEYTKIYDLIYKNSLGDNDYSFNSLLSLSSVINNLDEFNAKIERDVLYITPKNSLDRVYISNLGAVDFVEELGLRNIDNITGSVKISDKGILDGSKFKYSGDLHSVSNVNIVSGIAHSTINAIENLIKEDGILVKRMNQFNANILSYEKDIVNKNKKIDKEREDLIKKYSEYEASMAQAEHMLKFIDDYLDLQKAN